MLHGWVCLLCRAAVRICGFKLLFPPLTCDSVLAFHRLGSHLVHWSVLTEKDYFCVKGKSKPLIFYKKCYRELNATCTLGVDFSLLHWHSQLCNCKTVGSERLQHLCQMQSLPAFWYTVKWQKCISFPLCTCSPNYMMQLVLQENPCCLTVKEFKWKQWR